MLSVLEDSNELSSGIMPWYLSAAELVDSLQNDWPFELLKK